MVLGLAELTRMTDSRVVDFYSDFVRLGCCDLNIFNRQILARFPGDCGLNGINKCPSSLSPRHINIPCR